jgi:hypothetical protein
MFTEGAMENINKIIISGTSNWNKIVFDMNYPIEQRNSTEPLFGKGLIFTYICISINGSQDYKIFIRRLW